MFKRGRVSVRSQSQHCKSVTNFTWVQILALGSAVSLLNALWNKAVFKTASWGKPAKDLVFVYAFAEVGNLTDVVITKRFAWRFPSVCAVPEWQGVCRRLNSSSECQTAKTNTRKTRGSVSRLRVSLIQPDSPKKLIIKSLQVTHKNQYPWI